MLLTLVGAVCNLGGVAMVDELLIAQKEWLPQYAPVVEQAIQRWSKAESEGTLIPPREIDWPARLDPKPITALRSRIGRNSSGWKPAALLKCS